MSQPYSTNDYHDEDFYHDLLSLNPSEFFLKYQSEHNDNWNHIIDDDNLEPITLKRFTFHDISSDVLCYIIMIYLDWKTVFTSCLLVNKDFFRKIANNRALFINLFNELFVLKEDELMKDSTFKQNIHKYTYWKKNEGLGIPNEYYHYWKDFDYYANDKECESAVRDSVRKFHISSRFMTETKLKLIREKWNAAFQVYKKCKNAKTNSKKDENQALLNLIKRIIKDRLFIRKLFNSELKSICIEQKSSQYFMNKHSINYEESLTMVGSQLPTLAMIEMMVNGGLEYTMDELEEIVVGDCWASGNQHDEFIQYIQMFSYAYCDNIISFSSNDLGEQDRYISYLRTSDIKETFEIFPNLKSFISRGNFITTSPVKSVNLSVLVLLNGGMHVEVLRGIFACEFPQLKHLELWLGSYACGNTVHAQDFNDLLSTEENGNYPLLEYFGIRNAEMAEQYLIPVVNSNLLRRLRIFDMSLCGRVGGGNTGQSMIEFAKTLEQFGRQSFPLLELVDFHNNYFTPNESKTMIEIFNHLGIIVDVTTNNSYHIAISE